jgi:hypothetical protein
MIAPPGKFQSFGLRNGYNKSTHAAARIKEIESYFLTLAGEGIMLSPIDYSLIQDWKKRHVPREVVLKGINRAFSETGTKSKGAGVPPRSLKQCASFVKCIEEYGPQVRKEIEAGVSTRKR